MIRVLALLLAAICAPGARAALAPVELQGVELAFSPGARLPLQTPMRDAGGSATTLGAVLALHPASVLLFVDYTCASVCGPALAIAATSLGAPALSGLDVGLVVIGLDPKDGLEAAARVEKETIASDGGLRPRARFLWSEGPDIEALTRKAGYSYRYDPETDQFAHPAAALLVTSEGRVARTASSLTLMPDTLRLSLVAVGEGRIGTVLDRIRLRCYAFDPATGLYTSRVRNALRIAGAITVAGLAAAILLLVRRERRGGKAA